MFEILSFLCVRPGNGANFEGFVLVLWESWNVETAPEKRNFLFVVVAEGAPRYAQDGQGVSVYLIKTEIAIQHTKQKMEGVLLSI